MNSYNFQELIDRGIINEEKLLEELEMSRRQEILSKHKHVVWYREKDGYWYSCLPDKTRPDGRRKIKRKKKEDLEDLIYEFYSKNSDKPTVNDMFNLWIDEKSQNITVQTRMKYESVFRRFIEPTRFGRMEIQHLTFYELDRFCLQTIGKDLMKAHTWADIRTDLIGIIRYARKKGYTTLSVSDFKDIDIPRNVFKKEVILPGEDVITHDEFEKITEYIDEHGQDIVLLGIRLVFKTGLRVGELAALRYEDFDFARGLLTVSRTEIKTGNPKRSGPKTITEVREFTKGAKGWREIIIDAETADIVNRIRTLNPKGEYLFEKNGKRINANAWTKKLPRVCAKLNIGTKAENGNYVIKKSMHKGRKNYASTLLHSGVEPKFVQAQMGHTDLHTTLQYYNRDVEELEMKRKALLPILETM